MSDGDRVDWQALQDYLNQPPPLSTRIWIWVARAVLGLGAVALLTIVGFAIFAPQPPPNHDPRQGWVKIYTPDGQHHIGDKICDHGTLIYDMNDGSGGPIPNSPECQR